MILCWNLFCTSICMISLFSKASKSHFALGWFEWTSGGKKEMVDAFIKYGNLLNGLWQSHWRSLFRCRWLPPWLPLSLVKLPVRERRRKLPPVFHLLTVDHVDCSSVYETDWLTDSDCSRSQHSSHSNALCSHYFPFLPHKFLINAAKKWTNHLSAGLLHVHEGTEPQSSCQEKRGAGWEQVQNDFISISTISLKSIAVTTKHSLVK